MASKNVTITYDPSNPTSPWQSSEQPITIDPGQTTITWSIQLATGATGSIEFDTSHHHPGIKMTRHWPGPDPTGTASSWSVTADDTLQTGDKSKSYHYGVNAIYTAENSTHGHRKTWDPDVQMDPP